MMKYQEASSYLNSFIDYESILSYNYRHSYSLKNLHCLLSHLRNPQNNYLSIIVTGTKGKGSVANILSSVISRSGVRTGLFTSPHLLCIRERIKIDGVYISKKDFAKYVALIKSVIIRKSVKGLTYFEILTAVGFLAFKEKEVEIAVLEVGLGGRLDAVNTASNDISVITPISYDHTHLLGKSLRKIAKEKCGIIKNNSFVITAPQKREVLSVIKQVSDQKNARLFCVSVDKEVNKTRISLKGSSFSVK
ncbi:MAG: Mur ligase family protein, partial [Candidatus Omnitrophota bacterium]